MAVQVVPHLDQLRQDALGGSAHMGIPALTLEAGWSREDQDCDPESVSCAHRVYTFTAAGRAAPAERISDSILIP